MLHHLPNLLTGSRLLLAAPLGYFLLHQDYRWALAVVCIAGATDALDGFIARRLGALSRLGAALDPVADKVLVTVAFLCFAYTALVPWSVAIAVIARDLVIVLGASCYYWLIDDLEFSATRLSKLNMTVQIGFCLLVLATQLAPSIPPVTVTIGSAAVLFFVGASGCDYIVKWSVKAARLGRRTSRQTGHDRASKENL
jgi:cardiolipin synthase